MAQARSLETGLTRTVHRHDLLNDFLEGIDLLRDIVEMQHFLVALLDAVPPPHLARVRQEPILPELRLALNRNDACQGRQYQRLKLKNLSGPLP